MARKNEPASVTENRIFPTRLRGLMAEQKVTQKQLAAVVDMRPQTVSLYVQGQSVPDINCLRKIADYFSVSADWLIGVPNSVKTLNADVAAVCKITGLKQSLVEYFIDCQHRDYPKRMISPMPAFNLLFQYQALDMLLFLIDDYYSAMSVFDSIENSVSAERQHNEDKWEEWLKTDKADTILRGFIDTDRKLKYTRYTLIETFTQLLDFALDTDNYRNRNNELLDTLYPDVTEQIERYSHDE